MEKPEEMQNQNPMFGKKLFIVFSFFIPVCYLLFYLGLIMRKDVCQSYQLNIANFERSDFNDKGTVYYYKSIDSIITCYSNELRLEKNMSIYMNKYSLNNCIFIDNNPNFCQPPFYDNNTIIYFPVILGVIVEIVLFLFFVANKHYQNIKILIAIDVILYSVTLINIIYNL